MGHSLALPARVLAVLDLQLYEVKFLGLFFGICLPQLLCFLHLLLTTSKLTALLAL